MAVELKAYPYKPTDDWTIEPATLQRDWMDQTIRRAAYRCLPLVIANQAGWVIGCPATFKASWPGKAESPLNITFSDKKDEHHKTSIASFFGSGIVSFALPWLFRTSEGIGLWVRGPANSPRSDVVWLEGFVETDWSPYPFTMNWKIMRPKTDVWFKKGDPICMLTPIPIGMLEEVEPRVELMESEPGLRMNFDQAVVRRRESMESEAPLEEGQWELTYTRGFRPDGTEAPVHRTNLKLQPFEDSTTA